ncbi:ThuA domain-containing protein [Actinomycetota bacterium]
MSGKKALVLYGGWVGHAPAEISYFFKEKLEELDFKVYISDDLDILLDNEILSKIDLIIMQWTGGRLTDKQLESIIRSVGSGTGLAGCHGFCGSFAENFDWSFITGGQFVAHPGGLENKFTVKIVDKNNPIMKGVSDFSTIDEQYYMLVDPGVKVLATTRFPPLNKRNINDQDVLLPEFLKLDKERHGNWNTDIRAALYGPHINNCPVDMPAIWTKCFGNGRVFFNSLGHDLGKLKEEPSLTITLRGFLWASNEKII